MKDEDLYRVMAKVLDDLIFPVMVTKDEVRMIVKDEVREIVRDEVEKIAERQFRGIVKEEVQHALVEIRDEQRALRKHIDGVVEMVQEKYEDLLRVIGFQVGNCADRDRVDRLEVRVGMLEAV